MRKPLAPFGQYLAKRIVEGEKNLIAIIFMGDNSWKRATEFQELLPYTLCLPPKESPFRYDWKLTGCEVYLVDTATSSPLFIRNCATCFLSHGAIRVQYVSRDLKQNFKRS